MPNHSPSHFSDGTLGGTPSIYAGDEYAMGGAKERRAGGDDAIRPEFPPDSHTGLTDADDAIYRLYQHLIGVRRRHPWLHWATSTTLELRNDQYLIQLHHGRDSLHIALNLADHPLQLHELTPILAADPETHSTSRPIAPHGWAVLGGGQPTPLP